MLLDRLFRLTRPHGPAGRHRAGPRHLTPRQVARTVADLAQDPPALATVVQRHLDGETRRMPGAELLTDETRVDRVPEYLTDPYSGATA